MFKQSNVLRCGFLRSTDTKRDLRNHKTIRIIKNMINIFTR